MVEQTLAGRLIGGRYLLVGKLGSGGFARVWRAHDQILGVDVAIKEVWLPPIVSPAERDDRLARAEREARSAARLRDHLNIVAVHDVVRDGDVPWIVMQLVAGQSLAEHLQVHGPMRVAPAAHVARSLLYALGAAHEAGIVHRDVKPGNVLLAERGEVLLTDFGIAVSRAEPSGLTQTGSLIGSAEYLAPERLLGTEAGPASDLFSLGVTLYHAVRGYSPFYRETPAACIHAIMHEHPPPPRRAAQLAPLIMGLLQKNPQHRPNVAQALGLLDGIQRWPTPTLYF